MTGSEALDAFLLALRARDTSPHTQRAYGSAVRSFLAWLDDQPGSDWRTPSRRELRAWLASLSADGLSRASIAARLAAMRSFYRHARRAGLGDERSVGGDRDAAPLQASAQGARHIGRGVCCWTSSRTGSTPAHDRGRAPAGPGRGGRAIELRDRAIVETAYGAGLRISELAGADVADLDLRRGEIRVLGKRRKERIGLVGGPALDALPSGWPLGRPRLRSGVGRTPMTGRCS